MPSYDCEAIERQLGVPPGRGNRDGLKVVTSGERENRSLVRRWLSASGIPAAIIARLDTYQLEQAYNRRSALWRLMGGRTEEEIKRMERIEDAAMNGTQVTQNLTPSLRAAREIYYYLRARSCVLMVPTREEARAESYIAKGCADAGFKSYTWDCAAGVTEYPATDNVPGWAKNGAGGPVTDLDELLELIRYRSASGTRERAAWILRDATPWISPPIGIPAQRRLKNLAKYLPRVAKESAQAIILLGASTTIPPELDGHVQMVPWPLPDRSELGSLLDTTLEGLPEDRRSAAASPEVRAAALDAALGLSGEEAETSFTRSLVINKARIDPAMIAAEKKRVIQRSGLLEWVEPIPGGLAAVGGYSPLKGWLMECKAALSPQAREYGLPLPKGAMFIGVSGCGKSLLAKCIPTAFGWPCIRFDLGALKSKFVGESEQNLRRGFQIIESVGRCVVWLDEIEKAMAGAVNGAADGGVSADALGTFLTWQQDQQTGAFVVATANDYSKLPPEFGRKGRFDEVFFIDLPKAGERIEILAATLRQFKRDPDAYALGELVDATEAFTGSEIASLVPSAMRRAFPDNGREFTAEDMLAVARQTVPLARTNSDVVDKMREWAKGRARPASLGEPAMVARTGARQIDL